MMPTQSARNARLFVQRKSASEAGRRTTNLVTRMAEHSATPSQATPPHEDRPEEKSPAKPASSSKHGIPAGAIAPGVNAILSAAGKLGAGSDNLDFLSGLLGGAGNFLPTDISRFIAVGQSLVNGGLAKLLNSGMPDLKGLLSLDGLEGIATQFLPPWAGDAYAAGKALMSGNPMAMLDGLVSKFMPPELKAAYDALKKSGALDDLKSAMFAPPADKQSETPKSGTAPWAARLTDPVVCSGGAGVIVQPCLPSVLIGGLPAARVTDVALCNGTPTDSIAKGEDTVLIGNLPAARMSDPTAHGGQVTQGFPTVHIGKRVSDSLPKLNCADCLNDGASAGSATIGGSGIAAPEIKPRF